MQWTSLNGRIDENICTVGIQLYFSENVHLVVRYRFNNLEIQNIPDLNL